jgi:hypothetical protein
MERPIALRAFTNGDQGISLAAGGKKQIHFVSRQTVLSL